MVFPFPAVFFAFFIISTTANVLYENDILSSPNEDTNDLLDVFSTDSTATDVISPVFNDQLPASNDLISSESDCNPDAPSKKKRQSDFDVALKQKSPPVPGVCNVPSESQSEEEYIKDFTTTYDPSNYNCPKGTYPFCCAISGAKVGPWHEYCRLHREVPLCNKMPPPPPLRGAYIKGFFTCCKDKEVKLGLNWRNMMVPWGLACE